MATYDVTGGSNQYGSLPMVGNRPFFITLDFAHLGTDQTTQAEVTSLAAGDTVKILRIPAGTEIELVTTHVLTAAPKGVSSTGGAAQNVKLAVGDASSSTRYNTAVDVSTSNAFYFGDASTGGTYASGVKYFYTSASTLNIVAAEAVSKGKFQIAVKFTNFNTASTTTYA